MKHRAIQSIIKLGAKAAVIVLLGLTMDGTMVFGNNSGIYEEELCSQVVGMTEGENPTEIYESAAVSKNPSISGRMVYFSDSGDKLFKVYIKGFTGFKISNFCVGVLGAATA